MHKSNSKFALLKVESTASKLFVGLKLVSLLMFSTACAAEKYDCVVQSYYHLTEDGKVVEHEFAKSMKGNEFTVNKENGFIDGSTTNRGINTFPKVLLEGDGKQPFVAVTVDAKGRYVYQLHIANWNETLQKPFIFYRGSDMMSGVCVVGRSE